MSVPNLVVVPGRGNGIQNVLVDGVSTKRLWEGPLARLGDRVRSEKRIVGFRNHWTGVRESLCGSCLGLAVIAGHLEDTLPVPVGCSCRVVLPNGHRIQGVYVPICTPGASYDDLVRDGGANWLYCDWVDLVFTPIYSSEGDLKRMIGFVSMLQYFFLRGEWEVPETLWRFLADKGFGETEEEILQFIHVHLVHAQSYVVPVTDAVMKRKMCLSFAAERHELLSRSCYGPDE